MVCFGYDMERCGRWVVRRVGAAPTASPAWLGCGGTGVERSGLKVQVRA